LNTTSLNSEIYIGLGSNLESPRQQVQDAIKELRAHPAIFNLHASSLYQSKPLGPSAGPSIGPSEQPDYINAVVQIATSLAPQQLLFELQQIENLHQRKREIRWGPRTLDLDILLWHQQIINTPTLNIPHLEVCNRDFVLIPLYELNRNLHIPTYGPIETLVRTLEPHSLKKLIP